MSFATTLSDARVVAAMIGGAVVAAVLVTAHASALAAHPLRAPAERGAAACAC